MKFTSDLDPKGRPMLRLSASSKTTARPARSTSRSISMASWTAHLSHQNRRSRPDPRSARRRLRMPRRCDAIDGLTKRLESALKLFDENCRVYQYLFKRNNETHPLQTLRKSGCGCGHQESYRLPRGQGRHALFAVGLLRGALSRVLAPRTSSQARSRKFPEETREEPLANLLRALSDRRSKFVVLGPGKLSEAESALLQKAQSFHSSGQRLPRGPHSRQAGSLPRPQAERSTSIPTNSISPSSSTTPSSTTTCPNRILNATAAICAWTITTSKFSRSRSLPPRASRSSSSACSKFEANYYVVTEWKKEDSGKTRRPSRPSAATSTTPSDRSSARST